MIISPTTRVMYEHNPLAEVLCQIRFENIDNCGEILDAGLRHELIGMGYPVQTKEQELSFNFVMNPGEEPTLPPRPLPTTLIYHFSSEDNVWKVSFSDTFIAVTCSAYQSWEQFKPRIKKTAEVLHNFLPSTRCVRIGLRYKDIIEREPLGLTGTPWSRLISPFLLGPLCIGALSDETVLSEEETENFISQAQLNLDDCKLLLQSSLLTSADNSTRAFLIDADFFDSIEEDQQNFLAAHGKLDECLNVLHNNAGALFRRAITEELHAALRPR